MSLVAMIPTIYDADIRGFRPTVEADEETLRKRHDLYFRRQRCAEAILDLPSDEIAKIELIILSYIQAKDGRR